MMDGIEVVNKSDKPKDWPANAKEYMLERVYKAVSEFEAHPSYITKERLLALICDYDLNQRSFRGLYRVTEYEVSCINALYMYGALLNINALKVYTYELVSETARLQKNVSYMSESFNEKIGIDVKPYEEGLLWQLKFMYFAYQKFTVEKSKDFADQIIEIVEDIIHADSSEEAVDSIAHAYINMMNDISYTHGNKKFDVWKFNRDELEKLFVLEIKLITMQGKSPVQRPLKGVLMTQISNFILKSRHNYNDDYICKYVSKDVAQASILNHEIWMNKTENLNDDREQKVIPELFKDSDWISFDWAKQIDFSATRTYFVSSFSKSYSNEKMGEYGDCVYGFKGDRLVELLAPIQINKAVRKEDANKRLPYKKQYPSLAQVIAFDILYDETEAKEELAYLMKIVDKFSIPDDEKRAFLQDIMQYWILSVKDSKWSYEKERRYVLFLYKEYNYQEMEIDDGFLKLKTSAFILPDFILGDNPVKKQIGINIDNKRKAVSMKDYVFCKNCFSRDYDSILDSPCKCSICGSSNIELVHLTDDEK